MNVNNNDSQQKIGFLKRKNIEFSVKRYGIEALGAMALGLFASLIVGLILEQIGKAFNITMLISLAKIAKIMMGPAIGAAVAAGLKAPNLVIYSSIITGAIGAQATYLLTGNPALFTLPGEPVSAFIAAAVGAEFGKLIAGETKVDIVLVPSTTIITGGMAGIFIGPFMASLMAQIGSFINFATTQEPFIMGILVSTVMGIILTLPISSAALAISLKITGLAAGAATAGCASHMIGFAVASFRENGFGGLIAQGLGTSMLQVPNTIRNPRIWLPAVLTSIVLGPISTMIFKMKNVPAGAGMGTSGLVGQITTLSSEAMGGGADVLIKIALMHFILPSILSLIFSEALRKMNWIKSGDMKLDL
ncbi:PTS sugar transporter subunit IIC [Petroclostridium sp. X23]|uniref:PTS transporter subunit IIC n=1 Tax=Petroclostridium sp. X23 TaxID=3045146 RepID=UPI0024AD3938|nr:PTS sugar transporter subunit IIC [Petroclostridium sp. X23]WHH57238.1 PTS sugar transporter subunit IIC [Petroclostridium sp. X23]